MAFMYIESAQPFIVEVWKNLAFNINRQELIDCLSVDFEDSHHAWLEWSFWYRHIGTHWGISSHSHLLLTFKASTSPLRATRLWCQKNDVINILSFLNGPIWIVSTQVLVDFNCIDRWFWVPGWSKQKNGYLITNKIVTLPWSIRETQSWWSRDSR